jgi:hypothetical protein
MAGYSDDVILALEKAIKMIKALETTVAEQEKRINYLELKVENVSHSVNADTELYEYMIEHKDDPAFEIPLTSGELALRTNNFYARKK